ncbi:DNA-binding beta-propeller fold protein YncE [Parasphingorhabdus marina DSM 22363]|uniref:DNA-binding beta-propeller fold protein YncE n=1 Tax=Parasphingorhabdus marina DSM 22363 TaxID=1123272 RepID=A0A1N6EH20_9SPHN|nr:hypothetical protein [Parasphingorhabdus marina]SIN82197.1 DNA-binding beta-propeller fold protein YncE [Parasphingorhabdus marina DSM 22363]
MKIKTFLLIAIVSLLSFSGIRMWQERTFGTGSMESATALAAESREVAFVANAVGATVSILDVSTRQVVDEIDVTPDGKTVGFFRDPVQYFAQSLVEERGGKNYAQDTDLSRDGRVLFVSRGFLADVVAIDLKSHDIIWRTPIAGLRSDHMDITPDGTRLFVSAVIRGGNIVEVLDTRTGDKLGHFQTGDWPHDVHVSSDGSKAYAASLGDMEVDVRDRNPDGDAYRITEVDANSLSILREYRFDAGIRPFQISGSRRRLFAQLSNTHSLVAHDLQSDTPVDRLDLPVKEGVSEEDWDFEAPHHGLALSPDENSLCIAGRASDYAAFVDAGSLSLQAVIDVGNAPSWSVFSADGSLCLLANTRSDDVSFVSRDSQTEIARVPTGRGPKHITLGQVPVDLLDK